MTWSDPRICVSCKREFRLNNSSEEGQLHCDTCAVERFDQHLRSSHATFPIKKIQALLEMKQGDEITQAALATLPALLHLAYYGLRMRWHSVAMQPDPPSIVLCWSDRGIVEGFKSLQGQWLNTEREPIEVRYWRHIDGPLAYPWHDQAHDSVVTEPGANELD